MKFAIQEDSIQNRILQYFFIIKAHGGELNLETKEGEGSTFIIQSPL